MRLLFELPYPGYLRVYGSTVRLLAERGHTVLLSYDLPAKRRDPAAAQVESLAGVELVPPLPTADRRLAGLVGDVRLAADYLRFLDSGFGASPYLRRRLDKYLRGPSRALTRAPARVPFAAALARALVAAERLVPSPANVERALSALAPDAVVVTPLITRGPSGVRQTDTIKAARGIGVPVALAVASWDHLTTKGLVKETPDRIFVWNEIQRREAVELHRLPGDRVVSTGAQLFDGWFERRPSTARATFLGELGLDPGQPSLLFVGSSPNIAPAREEIAFVRRWLGALRGHGGQAGDAGVLVRPHPGNMAAWAEVDLSGLGAAVAPRTRPGIPMDETDEALYFDSIHHAAAIVGINTSAMIESLVQRRPVLTVRDPAFAETQEGTRHFRYLLPASGGAVRAADSLEEHLEQLDETLADPEALRARIEGFVESFLRPRGLDRRATPILADEIEALLQPSATTGDRPGGMTIDADGEARVRRDLPGAASD
jgi:hypothetical protein